MRNYELEREEREIEREMKAFQKVMKEREQRIAFAQTLENPILKQMVLDTIDDDVNLFELPDTKANSNLKYYDRWRKGGK